LPEKTPRGGRLHFSRVRGRRLFFAYAARHYFDRFGFFSARDEGIKDLDVADIQTAYRARAGEARLLQLEG
jgi:hypothetical protein